MSFLLRLKENLRPTNEGMEMVQVAILIGIAVIIGLIFKTQITNFVEGVFAELLGSGFAG